MCASNYVFLYFHIVMIKLNIIVICSIKNIFRWSLLLSQISCCQSTMYQIMLFVKLPNVFILFECFPCPSKTKTTCIRILYSRKVALTRLPPWTTFPKNAWKMISKYFFGSDPPRRPRRTYFFLLPPPKNSRIHSFWARMVVFTCK